MTKAVICSRGLGLMTLSSSHLPSTIACTAFTTSSFVVVPSRSHTVSVTFGALSDNLSLFLTTLCKAFWKAFSIVVEPNASRTLPFSFFLRLWIVSSTSSGFTFCFRFLKIWGYVIPASGVITMALTAAFFFLQFILFFRAEAYSSLVPQDCHHLLDYEFSWGLLFQIGGMLATIRACIEP